MDLFITEWWKWALALGGSVIGAAALAWFASTFVRKKAHDDLVKRVNTIEQTVKELPSSDDLHELDKRLIEVGGKIDVLSPQLGDLKRITDLLMENELRGTRNAND
ncbi:DUF2730 family protein [Pseudoalteromonas rubra]|uniref:DUF2730 domain-containing protein n=1 Tax=Pseudoalteromonas rubra TaxID=43658 RepID=A0A0F4QIZ6_9GAMM|nr:DUF2730 family protein [Pseudoalteromonas rubra]KJZ07596.1 hypothetical protein TW77_14970 [Pseudoalteromonas rubra]